MNKNWKNIDIDKLLTEFFRDCPQEADTILAKAELREKLAPPKPPRRKPVLDFTPMDKMVLCAAYCDYLDPEDTNIIERVIDWAEKPVTDEEIDRTLDELVRRGYLSLLSVRPPRRSARPPRRFRLTFKGYRALSVVMEE